MTTLATAKRVKAADLFCGAGGASTGLLRAAEALGLEVDLLAVNHWPIAIETHSTNHPTVRHLCESVEKIDPREVVSGGRLHLLLAGPECTHFSTARGGRPVNPQSRASAWHILKWAQELYIDSILIENVPEFRTWGPIGANGQPLKSKKGETYRAFLAALRSLGYSVEDRILNAADFGDPTTRQRLFIMARRGRHAVSWPPPTHSRTGTATLFGSTKRWRPAREVIDWSIQGRSIFHRKKPLKPATIARILAGLEKFGGPELRPFLVVLRQHMGGRSLDEPVPTLAANGQHVGLAQPFLISAGGAPLRQPRSTESPVPTVMGSDRLAVVEPFVLQQQSGGAPRTTSAPLPTIAAKGAISLVQPCLVQTHERRSERVQSVDAPLKTITALGGRCFGLAEPFLVPYYTERKQERHARTRSVDEPLPTITASGGGKVGVVEPFIVDAAFGRGDDTWRTRSIDEPVGTIPGSNRFALAEPFLTKYNRTATKAYSVEDPLDTVSTRDRFALVQPVIDGYALDIHFRMLQPHELSAAMSFPRSYVFCGTRADAVKQIGNSWPGELSMALNAHVLRDYLPAKRTTWRRERTA